MSYFVPFPSPYQRTVDGLPSTININIPSPTTEDTRFIRLTLNNFTVNSGALQTHIITLSGLGAQYTSNSMVLCNLRNSFQQFAFLSFGEIVPSAGSVSIALIYFGSLTTTATQVLDIYALNT